MDSRRSKRVNNNLNLPITTESLTQDDDTRSRCRVCACLNVLRWVVLSNNTFSINRHMLVSRLVLRVRWYTGAIDVRKSYGDDSGRTGMNGENI